MDNNAFLWLLLAAVLALLGVVLLYNSRKHGMSSIYSEQVLRALYQRAHSAAVAWVDDIPEDGYLGVERAQFFVKKGIVRVHLKTAYQPSVDVFFYLKKGEWHRGEIFCKGVQVR